MTSAIFTLAVIGFIALFLSLGGWITDMVFDRFPELERRLLGEIIYEED